MSHTSKKNLLRRLAGWHRTLGLVSAAFIFILVVTGVMMNHSTGFGIQKEYIQAPWLLDYYHIAAPAAQESFLVDKDWVARIDNRIYFDTHEVARAERPLIGAVRLEGLNIVATADHLFLVDAEGKLVDSLGREHGLPEDLQQMGVQDHLLAIQARSGRYLADKNISRWREQKLNSVTWSTPIALPTSVQEKMDWQFRRTSLTVERFVRDIHSGRIFGASGPWFMDAIALVFVLLAGSGIWIWWRARQEYGQPRVGRPKH